MNNNQKKVILWIYTTHQPGRKPACAQNAQNVLCGVSTSRMEIQGDKHNKKANGECTKANNNTIQIILDTIDVKDTFFA